jgi:hypothetical protein
MKQQSKHPSFRLFTVTAFIAFVSAIFTADALAQADKNPLPHLVSKDGRHALIVDDAPFLILGAQCHNSSA